MNISRIAYSARPHRRTRPLAASYRVVIIMVSLHLHFNSYKLHFCIALSKLRPIGSVRLASTLPGGPGRTGTQCTAWCWIFRANSPRKPTSDLPWFQDSVPAILQRRHLPIAFVVPNSPAPEARRRPECFDRRGRSRRLRNARPVSRATNHASRYCTTLMIR